MIINEDANLNDSSILFNDSNFYKGGGLDDVSTYESFCSVGCLDDIYKNCSFCSGDNLKDNVS